MRLLYPSIYDTSDVHAWSGTVYHVARTLQRQGFDVLPLGPLAQRRSSYFKLKRRLLRSLGRRYLTQWEPIALDGYAENIAKTLTAAGADVVFCTSTIPVARMKAPHPVIFWVDATFPAMLDYYPNYTNVCPTNVRQAMDGERRALEHCKAAIYSSDWAAESALRDLDADPAKVRIIPFGPNLEELPSAEEVEAHIVHRGVEPCRLLFIGVDWQRKGGAIAVQVADGLNRSGLRTELIVVGCEPKHRLPEFVRREGFISKHTESGRQRLNALIADANYLILPSRAEALGIVLAEACAYGVPCLAAKTGGVPTLIRDGVNGYTFELGAPADAYVEAVLRTHNTIDGYQSLARSAHRDFETRLSWEVVGKKVADVVISAASLEK